MIRKKGKEEDMIIKIIDDYEVYVDNNNDHEARLDIHKVNIVKDKDGNEKEVKQYKSIGHYKDVRCACKGIYFDMCKKEAETKESVELKEWIKIQNTMLKRIEDAMKGINVDL